jgi:hypothetical protein
MCTRQSHHNALPAFALPIEVRVHKGLRSRIVPCCSTSRCHSSSTRCICSDPMHQSTTRASTHARDYHDDSAMTCRPASHRNIQSTAVVKAHLLFCRRRQVGEAEEPTRNQRPRVRARIPLAEAARGHRRQCHRHYRSCTARRTRWVSTYVFILRLRRTRSIPGHARDAGMHAAPERPRRLPVSHAGNVHHAAFRGSAEQLREQQLREGKVSQVIGRPLHLDASTVWREGWQGHDTSVWHRNYQAFSHQLVLPIAPGPVLALRRETSG